MMRTENKISSTLTEFRRKIRNQIKPRWTTAVYLVSYDRTQELGLTLLGRVPMLALYPHTSLVYSYYYHNIQYLL